MNGRRARQARKDNPFGNPKKTFEPVTLTVQGEEVYYPRKVRRAMMRQFVNDIKSGRVDLAELMKRKQDASRQTRE